MTDSDSPIKNTGYTSVVIAEQKQFTFYRLNCNTVHAQENLLCTVFGKEDCAHRYNSIWLFSSSITTAWTP